MQLLACFSILFIIIIYGFIILFTIYYSLSFNDEFN